MGQKSERMTQESVVKQWRILQVSLRPLYLDDVTSATFVMENPSPSGILTGAAGPY